MGPDYDPVPGIERFLVSTPPLLSLAAIEPALALVEEAGVARIRAKGCCWAGWPTTWRTPGSPRWGFVRPRRAHRSIAVHTWRSITRRLAICQTLAAYAKVVCDLPGPGPLRIGPSPLYTRFTEVWTRWTASAGSPAEATYASRPADLPG